MNTRPPRHLRQAASTDYRIQRHDTRAGRSVPHLLDWYKWAKQQLLFATNSQSGFQSNVISLLEKSIVYRKLGWYHENIYIYIYIYIYIIVIIMSRRWHGYPWPSLATSPYRSSPLVGLQGHIPYPHIAAECMFELVVLLLPGHMWGPLEYITYELVPTSPAVTCMSGSSSVDSLRDGRQVAV